MITLLQTSKGGFNQHLTAVDYTSVFVSFPGARPYTTMSLFYQVTNAIMRNVSLTQSRRPLVVSTADSTAYHFSEMYVSLIIVV